MKKFDAIIIGSGQAGTPLAFKLAKEGSSVAFIEKKHLGGTCLNVGCTPTKTYVASARRMWDAAHGDDLGIHIPEGASADMKKIKNRKDDLIRKSVEGIKKGVEGIENIHFFDGEAKFVGKKQVSVGGEILTAPEIYINVGARPFIPEGFENVFYLTNESILELEEIPEHLLIVGGSYIGLEFGQMFRRFGSKVTILEKGERIISKEDNQTSETIQQILEEEGISIRLDTSCLTAESSSDGQIVVKADCTEQGRITFSCSHILLAVGRVPNTDLLGIEKTEVKLDEKGFIQVNEYLETSVQGIYALGDCNGKGAFTHTAYNDYEIVAENKFLGKTRKTSDRILTYGLFIDPPLGRAGITLKEAKEKNLKVLYGHRSMKSIARAKEKGETKGFMSVIVDAQTKKILGACVLGTGGDEIISSFLNMMYAGASFEVIRDSVHPHPTVSELIPTMLEALDSLIGRKIYDGNV